MKCFVLIVMAAALAIFPSSSFSAYLIKLKTGQEIITKEYWEQNGEIKFLRYGGAVGIDKNLIKQIEEVPFEVEEATKKKDATSPEPEAALPKAAETRKAEVKAGDGPGADKAAPPQNPPDLEPYREAYLALKEQHDQSNKRYWKARRTRDYEAKEKALREVQGFADQMKHLENQIKEKTKGVLPDWWK